MMMLFILKVCAKLLLCNDTNLLFWFCICALLLLEENPIPPESTERKTKQIDFMQ